MHEARPAYVGAHALAPPSPHPMQRLRLAALIEADGDGYVALCPEPDVASEGDSAEEARANLTEALELFFEAAPPDEVAHRLRRDVFVTSVEVSVG